MEFDRGIGLWYSKATEKATLFENIEKEHVQVGDVIYIEANSGIIKRVGRSDAYSFLLKSKAQLYMNLLQPYHMI